MNTKIKIFLLSALIFLNAFLIFAIQPIFAKDLLPLFGGSAGVWNVSCFFFQVLLLAGYVYAHKIHAHLKLHAILLGLSLLSLPFVLRFFDTGIPTLSIIAILGASVGAVYFLLSSTAPLVQRISGIKNPYMLYSASNMGALAALLAYPFLIEPILTRSAQKDLMSIVAGVVIIALIVLSVVSKNSKDSSPVKAEKIPVKKSLWWILLAFVPSSLMLGVTEYISSEMFVFPIFWIIPLGIYFLSFVFAFRKNQKSLPEIPIVILTPLLFAAMLVIDSFGAEGTRGFLMVGFHLFVFFYTSLLFHTKLAKDAPSVKNLTWFYVCLSIGGALGGLFNSIIAPIIFSGYLEYPLVLMLAVFLINSKNIRKILIYGTILLCGLIEYSRITQGYTYHKITSHRNFYGVLRIQENEYYTAMLMTSMAMHGIQFKKAPKNPAIYYSQKSPSNLFMEKYSKQLAGKNIALLGLGGGAMLCYATPGQNWDVFDINPEIFKMAGRHGEKFSYFDLCTPNAKEILGDGRLEMAKQSNGKYDLIIVDTFHGFAIPSHMLTRQAFQIYLDKLSPNGIILFHMNMMGMDLMPVLKGHITATKTYAKYSREKLLSQSGLVQTWMAVSKKPLNELPDWIPVPDDEQGIKWTDDFAPILPLIIW
jgi:spermidine synthase